MSYGSVNLAGRPVAAAGSLTSILMLLGILLSYALTWWRVRETEGLARRQAVMEGIVLTGLSFMLLGKVFSPQYLTWILPLCVSAAILRGGRKVQLLIVLLIATQVIYPITYSFVMQLQPWVMALVVARNLGLAVWGSGLIRHADPDASGPSPVISVESPA
jgi:hypothetical protein